MDEATILEALRNAEGRLDQAAAQVRNAAGQTALANRESITLRDHVEWRFQELQRAVDKAESTMNERLAGMNEFRDTLRDQAARFLTDAALEPLRTNIRALQKLADREEGMASQSSVMLAGAAATLGLLLSIATLIVVVMKLYQP